MAIGREAILSCYVENLQHFKVGWMRAADQTVLALQNRVVTHNSRYSVSNTDMRVWRLKISNIRETDRGCYMYIHNMRPIALSRHWSGHTISFILILVSLSGVKSTQRH